MGTNDLNEVFQVGSSYIFYAQSLKDNSIHIVNYHLLHYLVSAQKNIPTDEISYKVADSIQDFVARYDSMIVLFNIYTYHKATSPKIVNSSNFDIGDITRKVFIKPYILEFNKKKQRFYLVGTEQGSQLYMDKILKGENLDKALIRILKDEVGMANEYVGAHVHSTIEFDLDRDKNVIPRLVVSLYISEGQMTPEHRDKLERGWISPNDLKR